MLNIHFNNTSYNISEAALNAASERIKMHLSTVMNGSGATVNLGGTAYSVDSTKLSTATSDFISHLGTVSGSGYKVMVGGVEYGVDSAKMAGAVTELETVLAGLNNPSTDETLEGDGQEFHKFAPTALTFRSTAPLNELQEVQINGVTVDPSNYTTEEGSTVITLPIEYLKTLDVDNYEITVVSDSKSAKGGFSVVEPELNEHGFYYNQPYTAYVAMFGENESFFIREDGTLDVVGTPSGDTSQCTYTCSGNQMTVVSPVIGTLTATVSDDGSEIYCNELQISFVLGNESIAADDDYIYIYKEDLGGYEVNAIDKTKAAYGAIKTGINGIDTVKLADDMFYNNTNLMVAPKIPDTVTIIGSSAFWGCRDLTSITLPNSITTVDDLAFAYVDNLKSINITSLEAWCNISFGTNYTNPLTYNNARLYVNGNLIEDLRVPNGTTNINANAFNGYSVLTSVVIPSSVISIGQEAFTNCLNLTSVVFEGTIAQWNAVIKGKDWKTDVLATYVQCSDGQVAL